MPVGQELALIGSGPLNSIKLISRPSRYRKSSLGEERQWQLVSHLSLYHVALSEPNTARNSLYTLAGNELMMQKNILQKRRQKLMLSMIQIRKKL